MFAAETKLELDILLNLTVMQVALMFMSYSYVHGLPMTFLFPDWWKEKQEEKEERQSGGWIPGRCRSLFPYYGK